MHAASVGMQECWPAGTNQAGDKAVQTPLADGRHLTITFPEVGGAFGRLCARYLAPTWHLAQEPAATGVLFAVQCSAGFRHGPPGCALWTCGLQPPGAPVPLCRLLLDDTPPATRSAWPRMLQATCPQRIVFVLKEGEQWTNSGGGDFVAHLKPPGAEGGWVGQVAGCCWPWGLPRRQQVLAPTESAPPMLL